MSTVSLHNLVPLSSLVLIWIIFMITKNVMVKLIALLGTSLSLPLTFMNLYKTFWPCGLLLILMSTGLIVVFAYIVSLHEGVSKLNIMYVILMAVVTLLLVGESPESLNLKHMSLSVNVDYILSMLLIYMLLFLVISFVRLVYSKGGGFRKKF